MPSKIDSQTLDRIIEANILPQDDDDALKGLSSDLRRQVVANFIACAMKLGCEDYQIKPDEKPEDAVTRMIRESSEAANYGTKNVMNGHTTICISVLNANGMSDPVYLTVDPPVGFVDERDHAKALVDACEAVSGVRPATIREALAPMLG